MLATLTELGAMLLMVTCTWLSSMLLLKLVRKCGIMTLAEQATDVKSRTP